MSADREGIAPTHIVSNFVSKGPTGPLSPSAPEAGAAEGEPRPGMRIQQYELIRELGSGGMGTVFLARDTRLGRRVAIKFLRAKDPKLSRRLVLEARTTARCSHENIVVIYEVGEAQDSPFMVLEHLQGQPLKKLLHRQPLPPTRAVELMVPVVRALACAHEQNIVHRDLKPENIFVTDSGTIKVLDFGIAKVLQGEQLVAEVEHSLLMVPGGAEGGAELTHRGAVIGTLPFMSPEQWGNGVVVDHRTDIWAVGIMLYRMLAGQHPLAPLQGPQLFVTAALDKPMPRLHEKAPEVPTELAAVVDRCLLKRKEERFPDALALLRALEPFLPGRYTPELRLDESPYAGLSSFQEEDAARFFGRTREIAAVVNRIHDRPLLAVVGPSGAGKSSFVRAGLVPVLKRSEAWESLVIRPGRQPLAALASVLAQVVNSSTTLEEDLRAHQQLVERLQSEPGYAGTVLRSRARRERKKILLFIDQFEELYTQVGDTHERQAFTACLSGIADDATAPVRVVLALRSDFLDRVSEDERFMAELSQGLFFLNAPQREGLRDALVQPAEMAGYRFEAPELVEDMLGHLEATQGALPLLQFAASRLWEARDPARRLLTRSAYEAMGGITGALATHADSVLDGLSTQERTLVRAVFLRLVTPERTRAVVPVEELRELSKEGREVQRLVDHLVQARLLVVQTGSGDGSATVELVHESLLQGWPTLRRWLEEGQEDAAFLEQLRQAARQWKAKERDSGLLWRGEMVEEARRFQRRYRGELPKLQQEFLQSVLKQAARTAWLKRGLAVGSVVFLLALVAAAGVALVVISHARGEAERQAEVARKAEEAARRAAVEARGAEAKALQHLDEVKAKELALRQANEQAEEARKNAEAARSQAEAARRQAEAARRKEEEYSKTLQQKNDELLAALRRAEEAQQRAEAAKRHADESAAAARKAEEAARLWARRLEDALGREKEALAKEREVRLREEERYKKLLEQIGSPIVESLEIGETL
jgi:eukaryotic-like serine/threonine-protein kinase